MRRWCENIKRICFVWCIVWYISLLFIPGSEKRLRDSRRIISEKMCLQKLSPNFIHEPDFQTSNWISTLLASFKPQTSHSFLVSHQIYFAILPSSVKFDEKSNFQGLSFLDSSAKIWSIKILRRDLFCSSKNCPFFLAKDFTCSSS